MFLDRALYILVMNILFDVIEVPSLGQLQVDMKLDLFFGSAVVKIECLQGFLVRGHVLSLEICDSL